MLSLWAMGDCLVSLMLAPSWKSTVYTSWQLVGMTMGQVESYLIEGSRRSRLQEWGKEAKPKPSPLLLDGQLFT
jgi:hypothetical protein